MNSSSATRFIGFPNVFEDPSKVDRTTVGYNYKGLFKNGVSQIPAFGGWGGGEAALVFNPGGFEVGGPSAGLYANKYMPSAQRHRNQGSWHPHHQGRRSSGNGSATPSRPITTPTGSCWCSMWVTRNSLGNAYADLLTGTLNSYQETSFNRINDIAYKTYEGFVQDSWKVSPQADSRTWPARDALPALDRPVRVRLLDLRLLKVQFYLHSASVLRVCVEQARPIRALGRFPHQEAVLAAALRRGVRHWRQG